MSEADEAGGAGVGRAWWLSWYHSPKDGPFELHSPWWFSGMRVEPEADTVVAAVQAPDEESAWEVVRAAYDAPPRVIEGRFCEELESGGTQPNAEAPWSTPENGRFPRAHWMEWEPMARSGSDSDSGSVHEAPEHGPGRGERGEQQV